MEIEQAIRLYFGTQRTAATVGGAVAAALIVAAACLIWRGDGFGRGLAVVLAFIGIVFGGTGIGMTLRDAPRVERLVQGGPAAIVQEAARMTRVVANYRRIRIFFLALAAAALVLMALTAGGFTHGLAVGVLVLVAMGLTIDHYDRLLGVDYLAALRG